VSSRTQLRHSWQEFLTSHHAKEQAKMNRILEDAVASMSDLLSISLFGPEGQRVASTSGAPEGAFIFDRTLFGRASEGWVMDELLPDVEGQGLFLLAGPAFNGEEFLGVVLIRVKAGNLWTLLAEPSGLGRTGETLLLGRDKAQEWSFRGPTRLWPNAAFTPYPKPAHWLENQRSATLPRLISDYRGESVMAIITDVPQTVWTLVIKMDESEILEPLSRLRRMVWTWAFSLMVLFLIVFALLAEAVIRPLNALMAVTERIAQGSYDERVVLQSPISELKRTATHVNAMTETLVRALRDIKTLHGIVPICASCKKIRDDQDAWHSMEAYVQAHSEARFSHGLCPECLAIAKEEMERFQREGVWPDPSD
jgi:HAMP domain-containing protein